MNLLTSLFRHPRIALGATFFLSCMLTALLITTAPSVARESQNSQAASDNKAQITQMLEIQKQAWNAGKVDEFMDYYWKSDDLTFSSGGKVIRGWKATLQRYRDRYPTKKEMGTLEFSQLEVTLLGESAALVLGNWKLERESKPVGGNFSIVLRKIDGRWLIVHDHTSQRME